MTMPHRRGTNRGNGVDVAAAVDPDTLTLEEWRRARAAEHEREAVEDERRRADRAARRAHELERQRPLDELDELDPALEGRALLLELADRRRRPVRQ